MNTPSRTISLKDGGTTEPKSFFEITKKSVKVIADNKDDMKYGENLPYFTVTVLVDDESLELSGLTLSDLGLSNIEYATYASSNSDVGIYSIKPYLEGTPDVSKLEL